MSLSAELPHRIAGLTLAVLFLSACVSMDAVQDYASYTQKTVEEVRPVAKDFYHSCVRANSYKPYAAISSCDSEQSAAAGIARVANVLDAYGSALGELAADEIVSYDRSIGNVKQEINEQDIRGLDKQKLDAVEKLANLISGAATDSYRQRKIADFITSANTPVIEVSNTLASMIRENYAHAIELEISAWNTNYRNIERESRSKNPLEWERYARKQWDIRAGLQAKLDAASALAGSIENIGTTHAGLARDAGKLSATEVTAGVRSFIKQAKPVLREVQEAF